MSGWRRFSAATNTPSTSSAEFRARCCTTTCGRWSPIVIITDQDCISITAPSSTSRTIMGSCRGCAGLINRCVHGNEALDAARGEQVRIGLQKFFVVAMGIGEEEIIFCAEVLFDSADDERAVTVADFLEDDADREGALHAQGTGEEVGAVVQFARCLKNSLARALGNGAGSRGIIEDGGNRARSEANVFGNRLESYPVFPCFEFTRRLGHQD